MWADTSRHLAPLQAEDAPSAGGAFLASLQNTIWTSKDDAAPEAGKAAVASIDRCLHPMFHSPALYIHFSEH